MSQRSYLVHKSQVRQNGGGKRPPDDSLVSINPKSLKNNCFLLLKIIIDLIMMLSYCLGLTHQQHTELKLAAFPNDQGLFTLSPSKGTHYLLPLNLQTTRKYLPFWQKKKATETNSFPSGFIKPPLNNPILGP